MFPEEREILASTKWIFNLEVKCGLDWFNFRIWVIIKVHAGTWSADNSSAPSVHDRMPYYVCRSAAISWRMFSLRLSVVWWLFFWAPQRIFGGFKYGNLYGIIFLCNPVSRTFNFPHIPNISYKIFPLSQLSLSHMLSYIFNTLYLTIFNSCL